MAVTTLPHSDRPLAGRLILAVVVIAIVVTTFFVVHSQRSHSSVKPSAPAVTAPPPIEPGFTGTANSGPDNPAVGISPGLGETAGALGGGHPGAGPQATNSTCTAVVPHTRIC